MNCFLTQIVYDLVQHVLLYQQVLLHVKVIRVMLLINKTEVMINHKDTIKLTMHPCQTEQRKPTIKNSNNKKIDMKSFAFF